MEDLINYQIADTTDVITYRECILYALSVGCGVNTTQNELRFVYENELQALPMMANTLAYNADWFMQNDSKLSWESIVHLGHMLKLHCKLPTEGDYLSRSKVLGTRDMGKQNGLLVYVERKVLRQSDNQLICEIIDTLLSRADGGNKEKYKPEQPAYRVPRRAADMQTEITIANNAHLLYRLNGDTNPIHVDPNVTQNGANQGIILHGLCTLAHSVIAIMRGCKDFDIEKVKTMQTKFAAPVYPGETLAVEIFRQPEGIAFRTFVLQRNSKVLDGGLIT